MTTFTSSRLNNFREKKNSGLQLPQQGNYESNNLRLTLPQQSQKSAYDPTTSFSNTRTSMRLLKGRIQRKQSTQKNSQIKSNTILSDNKISNYDQPPKLSLHINDAKQDLKLVIHDSPNISSKKSVSQQPEPVAKKRIMITKEIPKQQQKPIQVKQQKQQHQQQQQQSIQNKNKNKIDQLPIGNHHNKAPIHQQQVQQSTDQVQNENQLVQCPQGCGRKFNRKALQKHAKACKLVFMSKRKQFNSQAKRLTSKQQAHIVKQNKLKQKKQQLGKTKGKGFDKTSDNWKAASEDFRSAIKAMKKQQGQNQNGEGQEQQQKQQEKDIKMINCQYCQKLFNQIFIDKHLENCIKKKEAEKKNQKKKK